MRRRLGTALAAATMVVAVAGCGGGSSSEGSSGSSGASSEESSQATEESEPAAPEADGGGDSPTVEELAADIEASSDGTGTAEDYRCLAQVMIDNDVPPDKVEAILSDDPNSLGDEEAAKLLDQLGPDLGKCYGVGG